MPLEAPLNTSYNLALLKNNKHPHTGTHLPGNSPVQPEKWLEGAKIDQFTLSIFLGGSAYLGTCSPFDFFCMKVEAMMGKNRYADLEICELSPNDHDGSEYTFSFGLRFNKKMVMKVACVSVHPYQNIPPIQLHIYSAEIQRMKITNQCLTLLESLFPPSIKQHVIDSRITRLDFAYDFPVAAETVMWTGRYFRHAPSFTKATTTQYFGSPTSGLLGRFYDKLAELLSRKPPVLITQTGMMRGEITLRRGRSCPGGSVKGLHQVKNPWLSFTPVTLSADLAALLAVELHLLPSLLATGLNTHLKNLTEHRRRLIRKNLKLMIPDWWKPVSIWAECLALLGTDPFLSANLV